jgi:Spy/CpxP family protein refolding chaperone
MLSPLNTLRAAVIGLALVGSAVTAMPAQAQPTVQFGFHVGGGGWHGGGRPDRRCLSDRDVRQLVRAQGYNDIRFADRKGRVVVVRAERGPRDYRITVDACRGRIIDVDRIRRR